MTSGEYKSGGCLWDLQQKYQPLLSYKPVLQNPSIHFMLEHRFCTTAHIKSAGKTNKKTRLLSAFCLFCRKQTNESIKAPALYTLGKIAVRFVTFKGHTY